MTTFAYLAVDAAGRRIRGRMEAANTDDLESRLARLGLDFVVARPLAASARAGLRIPRRESIAMFFHLEQLVGAGVPLADALADLRDSTACPRTRDILAGLADAVAAGTPLSQAMAAYSGTFDAVAVGLVRAGEATGDLAPAFAELTAHYKWHDELAAQARRLLIYPAFLGIVAGGLAVFLVLYLVPQLAQFFRTAGQPLPAATAALLALGGFVAAHGAVLSAVLVGLAVAVAAFLRGSAPLRLRVRHMALGLPLVGPVLRKLALARFASVLASLHAAGVPLLEAIATAGEAAGDPAIRAAAERIRRDIGAGTSPVDAFCAVRLFPPLAIRMLRIGTATGRLDLALRNAAYFHLRDVRETTEQAQVLVEPVLTALIGILIGGTLLAVLDPIYDAIARVKP